MDITPNQEEYELIEFLESNNLTYGVADYWDSNIITYLSNGRVTIRSVITRNGEIGPFRGLAAGSWYDANEISKARFILVRNRSPVDTIYINRENVEPYLAKNPNFKALHFRDYDIYAY